MLARIVWVRVSRPGYRTVGVGKGLGKVLGAVWIGSILLKGVNVGRIYGVERAEDGIGHGARVRGGKAETNRVAINNLVKESRDHECVRTRVKDGGLEG